MKYFGSLFTFLLSLGLLLNGCSYSDKDSSSEVDSAPEPDESYHKITAAEAKEMMDAGGVIIVDVRTAEEYAEKHIPGAILIPNESIDVYKRQLVTVRICSCLNVMPDIFLL